MNKVTESSSLYDNLENKDSLTLLTEINQEDKKVALAVEKAIPSIAPVIDIIADKMAKGGRLFYIGAGTSGRLGVLDASECPPTYGVPEDWVIGLIAGGDVALRKSIENAEDSENQAWTDLQKYAINEGDVLIGIAASGTTPYVIGGLKKCKQYNIITGSITCNPDSPVAQYSDHPIEVIVGPEYVTGSTRMKSGTAQKLVLNMISTSVMIKLGRVKGNKMVDMKLANEKLVDRGTKLIATELNISYESAKAILLKYGSVRKALDNYHTS